MSAGLQRRKMLTKDFLSLAGLVALRCARNRWAVRSSDEIFGELANGRYSVIPHSWTLLQFEPRYLEFRRD
jgi:hypothetical protein